MRHCSVPGCRKSSEMGLQKKYYYKLPADPSLRQLWINRCRIRYMKDMNAARVCCQHFCTEDYERDLQAELLNLKRRPQLKCTAIPTLRLPGNPVVRINPTQELPENSVDTTNIPIGSTYLLDNSTFSISEKTQDTADWSDKISTSTLVQSISNQSLILTRVVDNGENLTVSKTKEISAPTLRNTEDTPQVDKLPQDKKFICSLCGFMFSKEKFLCNHYNFCKDIENPAERLGLDKTILESKHLNVGIQDMKFGDKNTTSKLMESEAPTNTVTLEKIQIRQQEEDTNDEKIEEPRKDSKKATRTFSCKQCDFSTKVFNEFSLHKATHQRYNYYMCTICGIVIMASNMRMHMRKHTGEKPHKCNQCGFAFRKGSDLKRHMIRHKPKEKKTLRCTLCDYSTVNSEEMKIHRTTHSRPNKYMCELCGLFCHSSSNLNIHTRRKHTGEKPFKCSECDYSNASHHSLLYHMRRHTGEKLEKRFKCNQCGRAYSFLVGLKKHMKIHTEEKQFKCIICNRAFKRRLSLVQHMKRHNGDIPKKHKCDLCDYASTNSHGLKCHMRTHTGEKPFKCALCSYASASKNLLKSHMITHTGEKRFKCTVCDQAFARISSLKRHMKTHTGEKPFKCTICTYVTAHRYCYVQHMRRHTGDKPFLCSICGYASVKAQMLKYHMRRHTNEGKKRKTRSSPKNPEITRNLQKSFKCSVCYYATAYPNNLRLHMRGHVERSDFRPRISMCIVPCCQNKGRIPGVKYFRITKSRIPTWSRALNRNIGNINETANYGGGVCSLHFTANDFYGNCGSLKQYAVPSVMLSPTTTNEHVELFSIDGNCGVVSVSKKELNPSLEKGPLEIEGDLQGGLTINGINEPSNSYHLFEDDTEGALIILDQVSPLTKESPQIDASFDCIVERDAEYPASILVQVPSAAEDNTQIELRCSSQPMEDFNIETDENILEEIYSAPEECPEIDASCHLFEMSLTNIGNGILNQESTVAEECSEIDAGYDLEELIQFTVLAATEQPLKCLKAKTPDESFTSSKCNQQNDLTRLLEEHSYSKSSEHNNETKTFNCTVCNYSTPTSGELKTHVAMHQKQKVICELCGITLNPGSLKDHMRTHTGERPHKCPQCDYASTKSCDLKRHLTTHTEDKPYKCTECDYAGAYKANLTIHMRVHTARPKTFKCNICPRAFADSSTLKRHIRLHTGEKSFKCSLCDYATLFKANLSVHMKRHAGLKPFKCTVCDYGTITAQKLREHMMTHTGDRPFKCSICNFGTFRPVSLRIHMTKHSGEKPYKCEVCNYSGATSRRLAQHMKRHTGDRHFKCSVCDFATHRRNILTVHMRKHTGEKPYKCNLCDYGGAQRGTLAQHMKIHTGDKPFTCSICNYSSNRRCQLVRHTKVMHKAKQQ